MQAGDLILRQWVHKISFKCPLEKSFKIKNKIKKKLEKARSGCWQHIFTGVYNGTCFKYSLCHYIHLPIHQMAVQQYYIN